MNRFALSIGFWASLLAAAAFLIFTLCFVALLVVNPLFMWTDLSAYLAYRAAHGQFFVYSAQTAMLLFAPLYLLLLQALYEEVAPVQKMWLRIAMSFGAIFATLISINYFVQISAVRLNIDAGVSNGIEQFLQAKPDSVMAAVNMLGWTLFFGLSSLFVAPALQGGRLEKALRRLFFANGLCCLLAGVGYLFQSVVLIFLTINLGMGGMVTAITILLAIHFRRQQLAMQAGQLAPI